MDLTKTVSISGKSGLYKIVNQGKNVVIVESIADQKRFPAFGHEKMSSLEEITVFTTGEDKPLKDIFKSFYEKLEGKPAIDPKSENPALLKFFLEMVPDYDQEKVYVSDIRKMISWYNLLIEHNLVDFTKIEEEKTVGARAEESEMPASAVVKPAEEADTPASDTKPDTKTPEPLEEDGGKVQPEKKAPRKKKTE